MASWVSSDILYTLNVQHCIWHLDVMCFFILRFWYSMTPRYFILSASSTSVSSIFRAFVLHFSNCGLDPKRTNSVLSLFILSLFSFIQTFRLAAHSSSLCIHLSSSFHSPGLNLFPTAWSLAKPCRVRGGFTIPCIVLQYRLKSCAPAQDPWGTLKGNFLVDEYSSPIFTLQ